MNSETMKSVLIDGDKALFVTKGAFDRLKRDLKTNDQEKLNKNDYLKDGYTYQITSSTETQINVKIVQKQLEKPKLSEAEEKRKMLREKLRARERERMTPQQIKAVMKNKVPEDLLNEYLAVKRLNLQVQNMKIPILPPDEVINKPDEYKQVIGTIIQSFGPGVPGNNPIVNYYRMLAKQLGLPTTFTLPQVAPKPEVQKPVVPDIKLEVDDEMKKIYESLGIDMNKEVSKETENKTEVDDEMKKIYDSLGMSTE